MKIGIIGMGFVGGTTAKVFEKVHEIFPYDKFKEPYNTREHLRNLAKNSEVIFVCVPTPMKRSGEIDYSAIYNSLDDLVLEFKNLGRNDKNVLIVIRSTAVSGTMELLNKEYDFKFSFNPEFLRQNHALNDMLNTNRIIIGANTPADHKLVASIYLPLFPNAQYIYVNNKTAEMIKYAANVTLASQIAIANELYQICRVFEIDYNTIKKIILLDERIGKNIDVPGPDGDFGFGGKCFPKDLRALIHLSRENGYFPHLLEEIWRSNERVRGKRDWLDMPNENIKNENFRKRTKKYAISGHKGLIGAALKKRLDEEGYECILAVDKREGCDIRDLNKFGEEFKDKIDIFFHLAAFCKINQSIEDSSLAYLNNSQGTYEVLEFCKRNKIPKIVNFSSSRVLSKEENPYTASKKYTENLTRSYSECYGLEFITVRPSTVYGPYEDETKRLISIWCLNALSGKELEIYGDESKTLDFTYVEDFVDAVLLLLNHWEKTKNQEYDISGGESVKLIDLVKIFEEILGKKIKIRFFPSENVQPQQVDVDISKLKALGFTPKTNLREGVKRNLAFYKDKPSEEDLKEKRS